MVETTEKKDKVVKQISHKFWNSLVHHAKDMGKTVAETIEDIISPVIDNKKTSEVKENGKQRKTNRKC
jgi:macrodomain Ter protein organizer (MatP/YcbG family)